MLSEEEKKSIYEAPWPYGLADVLSAGFTCSRDDCGQSEIVEFTAKSVQQMIVDRLGQREAAIIEMRYRDKKSFSAVGEVLGISGGRCRQIEAKAMRKLYRRITEYASVPWKDWKAEHDARIRAEERLQFVLEHITYTAAPGVEPVRSPEEVANLEKQKTPIETLDLSVRSYNALKRKGIETVEDLLDIPDYESMLRIRNLGVGSTNEIISNLHRRGIKFKWEI